MWVIDLCLGGRLDRWQAKGGPWGQLQGSIWPTRQDEEAPETSGFWGRNCCKYRQNRENQTGKCHFSAGFKGTLVVLNLNDY